MEDYKAFVKYLKAGPHYASYPTAAELGTKFSYGECLKCLKEPKRDLSLYFHLPFCRSACYLCRCSVIYTAREESKERYLTYLFRELGILSSLLNVQKKVVQIHFGGGAPTFFSAEELENLILKIRSIFTSFDTQAGLSCEMDPRFSSDAQADVSMQDGFNRISFGVQDFNERMQKEIHRIQSSDLTKEALFRVRGRGIKFVDIDLIYGLPFQNLQSFKQTLDKILLLNPDRLAIFNYTHVPWLKKNMRKLNENALPNPNVKFQILEYREQFLGQNHYKMIGMDHFAEEDDELLKTLNDNTLHKDSQGYATKGGVNLVGVGLISIDKGQNYYTQNYKDLKSYEEAIGRGVLPFERGVLLNDGDGLGKAVIMASMANFKLDIREIGREFKIDFGEYFRQDLKALEEYNEFVSVENDFIKVNETGLMLIRNIAVCFDTYLKNTSEEEKVFSKTL